MKSSRRKFIEQTTKVAALGSFLPYLANAAGSNEGVRSAEAQGLQFSQIKLPYEYTALEPSIDAMRMENHYTKHHATYVKNVNEAIAAENIKYKDEKEFFSNA